MWKAEKSGFTAYVQPKSNKQKSSFACQILKIVRKIFTLAQISKNSFQSTSLSIFCLLKKLGG